MKQDDAGSAPMLGSVANHSAIPNSWIPVTERLPEKDTAVLVHTDMDGTHAASFDGEEWFCDYGGAWLFPNVTHWMPLPAPPTDDK
jgi:hypothetical protein